MYAHRVDNIPLKFFLFENGQRSPEVRRCTVDKRIATSLSALNNMISSMYSKLQSNSFNLSWTDNEGDVVTIRSDNELLTALNEMRGPVFKFSIEVHKDVQSSTHCETKLCGGYQCRPTAECVSPRSAHTFQPILRSNATTETDKIRVGTVSTAPTSKDLVSAMMKSFVHNICDDHKTCEGVKKPSTSLQTLTEPNPRIEEAQVILTPFGPITVWNETTKKSKTELEPKKEEKLTIDSHNFKTDSSSANKKLPDVKMELVATPFGPMIFWVKDNDSIVETQPEKQNTDKTENISKVFTSSSLKGDIRTDGIATLPADEISEPKTVEVEIVLPNEKPYGGEKRIEVEEDKTNNVSDDGEISKEQHVQPQEPEKENEKSEMKKALEAMLAMGFTNEGGWLEKLLETKGGNVHQALDVLKTAQCA